MLLMDLMMQLQLIIQKVYLVLFSNRDMCSYINNFLV